MKEKFKADKITYEVNLDEGNYTVGFSDNGDEPNQYIILQRAMSFDKQDVDLGMNSYYFEYAGQSNSGYGICKKVISQNSNIYFLIKDKVLDDISEIEVYFDASIIEKRQEFDKILNKIIGEQILEK